MKQNQEDNRVKGAANARAEHRVTRRREAAEEDPEQFELVGCYIRAGRTLYTVPTVIQTKRNVRKMEMMKGIMRTEAVVEALTSTSLSD